LRIGIHFKNGRVVSSLATAALLLNLFPVYATVVSPASADADNSPAPQAGASSPRSVTTIPRWSLPFDGSLTKMTPAAQAPLPGTSKSNNDKAKLDNATAGGGATAPVPSAVTLTPPPTSAKAEFSAAVQNPTDPPVRESSSAIKSQAPSSTAPVTDNILQAASSANASPQTSSAGAHKDYQVLNLAPQNSQEKAVDAGGPKPLITGEVTKWEGPIDVDRIVNSLVDKSFEISPEGQKLDKDIRRLSSPSQKVICVTKDSLNKSFGYQGFDPSARAGKLILDENYKLKDKAWAEYERQKYVDKIHAQVVASMMQIAEGLGMSGGTRTDEVTGAAKESLEALVGQEEALRTINGLKVWLAHVQVPESAFSQPPWDTIERNKKLEEILKISLKQDPVVTEVTKKVEHYANPGKLKSGTARVVETALNGLALLGPGFAIPIGAEVAEGAFEQSTGGSEQHKLERELLLDKRIQSRLKVLSQEAALALDNYRFALVTKNPPLLIFSEEILGNMAGKNNLTKIVASRTDTSGVPPIVPEIKESRNN
jgi:hypothetical protein